MLKLICKIEIISKDTNKKISFDYVNDVKVKTSCKSLGDTATVIIPRKMMEKSGNPIGNFLNREKKNISSYIKRGDEITIQLGYEEYGLKQVFKGYITQVECGIQITIKCEDKIFFLKRKVENAHNYQPFTFNEFIEKNKIKNIIPEPIDKSELQFGDINIEGYLRIEQALEKVVKAYPYLRVFFKGDDFYVTRSTEPLGNKPIIFAPDRNIIDDKELKFIDGEDLVMQITVETVVNKHQVPFPDEGVVFKKYSKSYPDKIEGAVNSTTRIFYIANTGSKSEEEVNAQLSSHAERLYGLFKSSRVSGSFTAFGEPFVQKGDCVKFQYGELRPELNDMEFVVDGVDYSFGQGGYRQGITLGYQAISQ